MMMLARKGLYNRHYLLRTLNFCFKSLTVSTTTSPNNEDEAEYSSTLHLSPFFSDFNHPTTGYDIELVDRDAWGLSTGVAQAWRASPPPSFNHDEAIDCSSSCIEGELDFEDIEDMRIRGNLFYKLERTSKEFEEYNLEFHRNKSSKKENAKEVKKAKTGQNEASKDDKIPKLHEFTRRRSFVPQVDEINDIPPVNKRQRTPTFNQLTGPYHEPFCLDIYISKASVRACIVHRVTSKVVAVAHSISKDIKFDLASTKNKTTCAAVGAILAHRAVADDIHDVIYTPRKGERLEGKLKIVLKSIIDNGINVKVKTKQIPKKLIRPHFT